MYDQKEEKKFGWSAVGIVGMVFLPMGVLFAALGVLMHHFELGKDPEDPIIFLCIFGGVGLTFMIMGLGLCAYEWRRRAGMRRALDSGESVTAAIAGVRQVMTEQRNGRHPFRVECHYRDPDTGVTHVYFSRSLLFDPTDMLTGKEVPVYVDPMNEKNYFVDIDAVLPKVVVH